MTNMILAFFKTIGAARKLNKLLLYLVIAFFCINTVQYATESLQANFSQLLNKRLASFEVNQ